MKRRIRYWIVLITVTLLAFSGRDVYAGPDDFQLSLRNIVQTAPDRIEFDLYLLDTDAANDFWLSTERFGILFNSAIYAGGSISASIVNTGSGLGPLQVIAQSPAIETDAAYSGQTLITLAGNAAYIPLAQCTMISKTSPGTLVTHFVLTSTVNFASGTTPDLVFTSSGVALPLYATGVTVSDGTITTDLAVTAGVNAIVTGNPVLNPAPIQFTVTGGGIYCEGEAGLPVGLSGSETGVTYTLYRGASALTPTVAGTGAAISFGSQTAGTYTVSGTNAGGTTLMAGNAVITMTPLPAVPVELAGSSAGCTQFNANWQSAAAATSYLLDVSTSNTFSTYVTGYQNRDVGNVTSYTVTGLVSGTTYYYRVRSFNSCGTSSSSGIVSCSTLSAPSQPGTITGSTTLCSGVTGQIYSVADVATATSYSWTLPAGWIITAGDGSGSITVTAGNSGGTISVTASNSCGTSPARTLGVTVNPTPVVTDQTTSINSGQTFTVTPAGTPAGTTYTWPAPVYTNGVSGGAAQPTGVTSISGTLTIPSGSGTAVYTVTPSTATCSGNSFTVTVTVTSTCTPVSVTTHPAAASVCAGGSAIFTVVAGGTSPFVYQWEYYNGSSWAAVADGTPAGTLYTGAAGPSLTVSGVTTPGSYQYRCHITNCSGSNSATSNPAVLTVNANPPQPVITPDGPLTFCSGGDVILTATESSGYLWSNGATTRSITVSTGGNYTVQVTNAAGCTSVPSATTVVTVNPLPSRPTITPSGSVSICAGSSQILTASSGVTYLWSSGESTPSISVTATGSYTVQVTNSFGCLSQPSPATDVTVNPLPSTPAITASGPTTICEGASVTLTSSLSSAYMWSTGATTRSITVTATGNYWVRVTDANGCQSAQSATTAVTVNPLPPTPTVGTITQPSCSVLTGSVVLSGLPAGSWTVNPGGITGSVSSVTVTGLTAGSYTFTVTNASGCTSLPTAGVDINAPPAVPTAPVIGTVTQPTCAVTTGSVGISGLPSSGTWTLTRNPGGNTTTGTGSAYTATGIPSGTYTYTVTNISGCISPSSASFTINAPLPVPATPSQTIDCSQGYNLGIVTVTTPTDAGLEFRLDAGTWQTGNTFTNVANGTHSISVRNASGCITTGAEFSVNCGCANPPLLSLAATTGSTCGLNAVTVSGNTFGGGATGVTITDNGGGTVTPGTAGTSPFSFMYTPVAGDAGRVVVITVTTDNPFGFPCTPATATYSLTVNANPVAPVIGTIIHPTCSLPSGSVTLNSLPATGDWTLTRYPGGETSAGSGTGTTVTGMAPGTYYFTVTNANGCVSPSSSNVVINAQPDTPAAPVPGAITQPTCAVSTGSVELSGLPATGTWTLTRTPGNVTITGSGTARTVTSIPPGTYTYTVINSTGCISPASAEVIIISQPVTPVAPAIGPITHPTCELSTGTIVLENMPETGEWTLIRYPGGTSSTGTGSSTTISSLPPGTYNFAVRNADGCTSLVSLNAVINSQPPTPTTPVVGTITHPTFLVPTGSVVLSGLPSSGIWTLIRYPDGFTSQGTGTTRTVSGLEPGTYTFAVTNSYGCTSEPTGNVVINARPGAPVVVINTPPNICENETTDLTLPAVTAGSDLNLTFTYWTDAVATVSYPTPAAAPAGTYYIMGTSTAGYYTIKPVVVTADRMPAANAGDDQVLEYSFGTTLNAAIPEIGTGIWELVSGTGDIFNSAAPSTGVSGLSLGENVFRWTVTNGACDPAADLVSVRVNNLTVPTLITPNQDGRNDYFVIRGMETLGRTELTVFDRRGLKVFESRDYSNDWEGIDYNGNPLPDDTYFYVVRADNGVSISGYIVVRR
jgi:gliding motility-associated-like protein